MAVAFLAAGAFFSAVFFSVLGSVFLGAAAAGFASFFASLTGPEVPIRASTTSELDLLHCKSHEQTHVSSTLGEVSIREENLPLGRVKSPFSSPEAMALFTWFLN